MAPNDEIRSRLAQRGALLVALLRREKSGLRGRILLWGGLRVLAAAALGAVALFGIAALAPALPRVVGWALALVTWVGFGYVVWRSVMLPLRAIPNLAVFARLVEERRDFRDMLRAALDFSQRGAPEGESVELAGATVDRAYEEAQGLRLTQFFEFPDRRRHAIAVAVAVAALAIVGATVPETPGRVLRGLAFRWPSPGEIEYGRLAVLSGDRTVLAGEDVEVAVRESGPQSPEVLLRFDDTGDLWKSRPLQPGAGAGDLTRDYAFRFENVRSDLVYRFESGRRRTDEHHIRVVQRPIVSRLQLRLVPPAYTGRAPTLLEEGRGDAVALVGTRVEIDGTASAPLATARLVPDGGPAQAVTLTGPMPMQAHGPGFQVGFLLRGDVRYHFELVDSLGHTNADPVSYQLSAIEDRAPYVEVREPGQDADLSKTLRQPLGVYASDDFGLSHLTLVYRRERDGEDLGNAWQRRKLELRGTGSTDAEGRPLAAGPVPEVLQRFEWSLEDAGLFPGDFITYYAEAEDNDDFSGHKTARSTMYRLRLASLSEMYAKIHEGDENRKSELDDALEKGKQLQQKYEKLARELKKNPEMDWKKEKEIQNALEKQKQVAAQVQKIAEDLQKDVQKMQDQQLVSQEIAQKLDEIRKLMEQVQDKTLQEYMQRLQEAMKQISPEEIQRAMEKMEGSQEEFVKRLERTKSLLEQLKREQALDQMIERVSELLKQQEQVGEKTQDLDAKNGDQKPKNDAKNGDQKNGEQKDGDQQPKAGDQDKPDADRLAAEQKELSQKTDELQKELDQLSKEANQAGQQQLDQANEQMQQENPSGEMSEASKQLQQKQPQGAQPHQQSAEKSLRGLYEQLMDAQQSMSMKAQAEAAEQMAKAARQALDVSLRQEDVSKSAPSQADPKDHGELAEQQQALLAATEHVALDLDGLAQKSLAAPPKVSEMLSEAMQRMQDGVRAYEKGNPVAGRLQGEEAYGLLNQAVVELNRSSSSSCKKPGSGGQGAQQAMDEMMGQQQKLNDSTRQFKQRLQNPQNMTPEERAEMSRLLGEQQSIQSQLSDIERKARESHELLGRLDKMQEEMHEVVQDMQSESLDDETLRVQEKIVSRMLDAQRSLHKRDFKEERESRTAEDIYSQGGKAQTENERIKKLRRDIDRALREGTPEEYEDLVREYFRAISETPGTTPPPAPVP